MTDISEIARNSVLISSMSDEQADTLIGGDDPCDASNIPRRRFDFRHEELVRNSLSLGITAPQDPWHMHFQHFQSHGGLAGRDVRAECTLYMSIHKAAKRPARQVSDPNQINLEPQIRDLRPVARLALRWRDRPSHIRNMLTTY